MVVNALQERDEEVVIPFYLTRNEVSQKTLELQTKNSRSYGICTRPGVRGQIHLNSAG
jgi:hypothetical protein